MTFVVTESCIKCKLTDCVEVCPVDCFHEGPNMLVIDPDECIDCTLCVAECPVEAIFADDDVPVDQRDFIELNAELAKEWPVLTEQKDDLETTLTSLRDAISRINRTSRRRFRETFEAVSKRFSENFPRLFRGGRASLALTESDDVLEAGIDIMAMPPGKRLQNVNLLSGGEKTLTAIALLVAVFQVRPSPFFLLDEVDAALDDANVGRFNEIVTELSGDSQFVLITHNKRTIEVADILYGVTMEEKGVSKLVAVRVLFGEPDESGRPGMEEVPDSEFEVPADLVLLAMGFLHPVHEGLLETLGLKLDGRGNVAADTSGFATSEPGIFAAGDCRRGQSLVVWAIWEGREAARQVDCYLMGESTLQSRQTHV